MAASRSRPCTTLRPCISTRGTQSDPLQRDPLVKGLKAMIPALERIAADGLALGLEPEVLDHLRPALLARAQELAALR